MQSTSSASIDAGVGPTAAEETHLLMRVHFAPNADIAALPREVRFVP